MRAAGASSLQSPGKFEGGGKCRFFHALLNNLIGFALCWRPIGGQFSDLHWAVDTFCVI